MKETINIIENNLGVNYIIQEYRILNDIDYTIYKEYKGSRSVVIKDHTTLSPFFNDLIEADNWINTNL